MLSAPTQELRNRGKQAEAECALEDASGPLQLAVERNATMLDRLDAFSNLRQLDELNAAVKVWVHATFAYSSLPVCL